MRGPQACDCKTYVAILLSPSYHLKREGQGEGPSGVRLHDVCRHLITCPHASHCAKPERERERERLRLPSRALGDRVR